MKKNDFPGIEDIVETVREPLLVLDADLNILFANRSFYNIFKVEQVETIGHLIFDVGNKQWDIPALRKLLEDILPAQKYFDNYEVEHDFPAIGHKSMLLNARQVYRNDVGTQMILLAIEDITGRKKVQKELEANEAKYRELVQNANSIILKMDPKGKVTFFNEFAQMFFGYTWEEMLGCSVVGTIVPETESSGRDLDFMIEDIGIHPAKYINNENENMRRNGERVWVAWTNKAIRDESGKVTEILCIGNDITEHKRLESLLEESEERYRRLFETANDGILLLEKHEGKITHANPAATGMLGYSKAECIGKKLESIGVSLNTGDIQEIMQILDRNGIIYYDDVPVKTKTGQYIDTDIYMVDRARLVQCNIRDITERKRAEAEREKLLQDLGERVKELGCLNDISRLAQEHQGSIDEFLQRAVGILPAASRYPEICTASITLNSKEFRTANFRETEWCLSADIIVDRKKFGAVMVCYLEEKPAADEGPFLKEERSLINTVAEFLGHIIQHRLSEAEIRASEQKLQYLAYYDSLTDLPNRNLFLERIDQKIAEAKDSSGSLAVLITDINKFKSINDIYGSEVGDRVIKEVAKRFSTAIRKGDTVARLGNDEFGIACFGLTGANDIIMLEKIIKDISYPFKINRDEIILTFSTGISLYPHDGENGSELLKSAGLALSIAEKQGSKIFQFYTKDMTVTLSEVMLLEKQLVTAIKNEEFILHYQPYWDINTKKMVGMEALIRLQSRDNGLVPPGKFIPVLEDTGMIIEVGEWILSEAMRQVKEWQNKGYPVVPVSVNLSLIQFRQKDLAEMIKKIMKDAGYHPSLLTLEITESAFMQNIEFTRLVLTAIKEIGCSVSIDDFGTGYSSLAYLKRFPIDNLKIDISFIREMTNDPDSASIVMAIINMAHTLSLKTIAEGIETEEQWNILRLFRCDMGQGFYLSKPLPAEDVEKLFM